jgi:hypothetical protein
MGFKDSLIIISGHETILGTFKERAGFLSTAPAGYTFPCEMIVPKEGRKIISVLYRNGSRCDSSHV